VNDRTNYFRNEEWNPIVLKAAKVLYRRLRMSDPDAPKWADLSIDAVDHYCIAARNCIEAFHYEAARNVIVYESY
jgi:hypothetical protein